MVDVLAGIYEVINKIGVMLVFIWRALVSGINFLWSGFKWIGSLVSLFPAWLSGIMILGICLAVVLLILGR